MRNGAGVTRTKTAIQRAYKGSAFEEVRTRWRKTEQ
nr:MAG TPA: hypothetical protein [Caudoviricetes sp.]